MKGLYLHFLHFHMTYVTWRELQIMFDVLSALQIHRFSSNSRLNPQMCLKQKPVLWLGNTQNTRYRLWAWLRRQWGTADGCVSQTRHPKLRLFPPRSAASNSKWKPGLVWRWGWGWGKADPNLSVPFGAFRQVLRRDSRPKTSPSRVVRRVLRRIKRKVRGEKRF